MLNLIFDLLLNACLLFFLFFFYPFSWKPEAPAEITARKKGEL